jgi:hypothetical protein
MNYISILSIYSVVSTVRKADYLANQVLLSAGLTNCISQMQVVMVPVSVHMDRSPLKTVPSYQVSRKRYSTP